MSEELQIPLASIIMPLYNKEASILSTINSVLIQTFRDFEIVIVNDGSTDNSVEIVSSVNDDRIRIINQENKGVSAARNRGIDEAKGKWIMFLDADDLLLPNALYSLIKNIIDDKTIVAGNYLWELNGKKRSLEIPKAKLYSTASKIFHAWLMDKLNLRAGSFIINKDSLRKIRFNESLSRYEDFEFWFKCCDFLPIKLIPDLVMIYRESFSDARGVNLRNWNKDYLFHINFQSGDFWKKCMLGEFVNYTYKLYPDKIQDIKNLYSKYWIYVRIGWLFRLYKVIKGGTLLSSLALHYRLIVNDITRMRK